MTGSADHIPTTPHAGSRARPGAHMIFFDLDGTLLDHDAAERQGALAFAAAFGLDESGFVTLWREASERYMDRFLAGEIDFAEQRRLRLQDLLGRTLSNDQAAEIFGVYLDAYERGWRLYPDVLPCLEGLAGTELGIITNGHRGQQLKKLEATAILEKFALVVTSEDTGAAKPRPEIFASACDRAGVERTACTYIGDRLETDARAAARAGLRGIWLDRAASGPEVADVEVIRSLSDLPRSLATVRASGR